MHLIDMALGYIGAAFLVVILVSMIGYLRESTTKFYFKPKHIRAFLCDVTAISGAVVALLACLDLMAKGLMGLLG